MDTALTPEEASSPSTSSLIEPTAVRGFGRFTRDTVLYGLGTLVGRAMGLVLLPVLTRALTPSEFGLLDVLWSLGSGLAGVLLLGLDAAALRLFFDRDTWFERSRLLSTWAILLGLTALTSLFAIIIGSELVSGVLMDGLADRAPVLALALVVPMALINQLVLTTLRATARPVMYAVLSVSAFVGYGLGVFALTLAGLTSLASVIGAWGVALAVPSAAGLIVCRNVFIRSFGRGDARDLVRLGLPLAPIVAAGLAAEFVLRATLLGAAGAAAVAQLSIAIRLASALMLIVASLQLAWQPRVYVLGDSPTARIRIARDGHSVIAVVAILAIVYAVLLPALVPILAGPGYERSIPTVGWCLAASVLAAAVVVAAAPSAIRKRSADLTISMLTGFAVTVGSGVSLTPLLDSVGAGIALALGQASALLVLLWFGRRRLAIPLQWPATLARLGLTVVVIAAMLQAQDPAVRVALAAIGLGAWITDPLVRDHATGSMARGLDLLIRRGS